MPNKYLASSFALFASLLYATAHASCGSTTCSINTNWDEHGRSQPGWSADLRYSYSHADTLRSGSKKIAADTSAAEVENVGTTNKLAALGLDYTYDEHWGMMVHVPYIMRDHDHNLGPYAGNTSAGYESFHASALGDVKVVGRYRWLQDATSHSEMGIKLGFKLNTGKKDFEWTTGGVPSEASLQPGNGSTDLIAGVFWHQAQHDSDWSWFAQGTLQNPIQSSATFRPGKQINLDGGTRYVLSSKLSGLLQLNLQWNGADSGTSAALTETGESSSGGRSLSLSPGLSYTIAPDMQLYGLVQLPLYQYVNGEQLTANSSVAMGIGYRF